MTISIIISLCVLILTAYIFDVSAAKTRIPSVVLLLMLGFFLQIAADKIGVLVPSVNEILPLLGTIGLILVVLEGALELEINKSKFPLILKATLAAIIPIFTLGFGVSYYLNKIEGVPFHLAFYNAIPLTIISSAIAIPSAANLLKSDRDFVTYESSLSDIFGVILFNFFSANEIINFKSISGFGSDLIFMLSISFIATIVLALLLDKITHHVKFLPIIVCVILVYAISKVLHLPGLIFILIFGLFIGNIDELPRNRWVKKLHPTKFKESVNKFKEINTELAFLIRAMFFILFGFLIKTSDLFNPDTIILSVSITAGIYLLRLIIMFLLKIKNQPILFVAPRGLITILLFLSIPELQRTIFIDKSVVVQVVVLTAFVMMFGLISYKKPQENIN